jgi:hypothetical protein
MLHALVVTAALLQAPTEIRCEHQPMKNLPDKLRAELVADDAGVFTFTIDNATKPEKRTGMTCRFHKVEPAVFSCLGSKGAWGAVGNRVRETAVDSDGNDTSFDGYLFELVKAPLGEARTMRSIRVPASACTTK